MNRFVLGLVACLAAMTCMASASAGTTFTYQGELKSGGSAVTGTADIRVTPWNAMVAGAPICACTDTHLAVPVTNGVFTVDLDFGAIFNGGDVYLAIEVRVPAGAGAWVPLVPRQPIMPTPYAMHAMDLANGGLGAAYTAPVSFTSGGNSFNGSHSGNGSGLTSLNASQLSSGVLPTGRLSGGYANVLNLTNAANTYNGTFSGSGAGLTSINANNITFGTLNDARLSSNVALRNAANTFTQLQTIDTSGVEVLWLEALTNPLISFYPNVGARKAWIQAFNSDFYITNQSAGNLRLGTSNTTRMTIDSAGNVGISTTTPEARLNVSTGTFVSGAGADGGFAIFGTEAGAALRLDSNEVQASSGASASTLFLNYWGGDISMGANSSGDAYMTGTGNFGLGTSAPTQKFHQTTGNMQLDGGGYIDVNQIDGHNGVFIDGDSGGAGVIYVYDAGGYANVQIDGDSAGNGYVSVLQDDGSLGVILYGDRGTNIGGEVSVRDDNGTETVEIRGSGAGTDGGLITLRNAIGQNTIIIDGDIGAESRIEMYSPGDATPAVFMDIDVNDNGRLLLREGNDGSFVDMVDIGTESTGTFAGGQILLRDDAGITTIQIDANYNGDGRIITQELQITGGSDLSEQFNVAANGAQPEPGMVVCIDADNPGELIVSGKAYDRMVAGIISGAGGIEPGLYMGQKDSEADGSHPVALTGRVYVYCDASYGAIVPGDLLTTCDVAGHAMKVTDHSAAQGAIIGKAMTSLEEGRGLVLVLVRPQ